MGYKKATGLLLFTGLIITLVVILSTCKPETPKPVSPLSPLEVSWRTPTIPLYTPAPGELLINPGFEGPFHVQGDTPEVVVGDGWTAYYLDAPPCRAGKPGCWIECPTNCQDDRGYCPFDASCYWQRPEFGSSELFYRVHSGTKAQRWFTNGREAIAGLKQTVSGLTPGSTLRFSAWLHGWQCNDATACCDGRERCVSDAPGGMAFRLGVDATGGSDPYADSVMWGARTQVFDVYELLQVEAEALGPSATVFISSSILFDWARWNNDVYLDDASLVQVLATPTRTPRPTHDPTRMTPGPYLPLILAGHAPPTPSATPGPQPTKAPLASALLSIDRVKTRRGITTTLAVSYAGIPPANPLAYAEVVLAYSDGLTVTRVYPSSGLANSYVMEGSGVIVYEGNTPGSGAVLFYVDLYADTPGYYNVYPYSDKEPTSWYRQDYPDCGPNETQSIAVYFEVQRPEDGVLGALNPCVRIGSVMVE